MSKITFAESVASRTSSTNVLQNHNDNDDEDNDDDDDSTGNVINEVGIDNADVDVVDDVNVDDFILSLLILM